MRCSGLRPRNAKGKCSTDTARPQEPPRSAAPSTTPQFARWGLHNPTKPANEPEAIVTTCASEMYLWV